MTRERKTQGKQTRKRTNTTDAGNTRRWRSVRHQIDALDLLADDKWRRLVVGIGGARTDRGDKTLGAIIGAVGGGVLGREIDRGDLKCR